MCTGNICRSPMAEGLLRAKLEARGVKADVSSTGVHADGWPASEHSVTAMASRDIDITAHRSRVMVAEQLERADLVLGLARNHVREAIVLLPESFGRTFTVKEFVRRAEQAGPRSARDSFAAWVERVGQGRKPNELAGAGFSADDDVADPIGQDLATYEQTAVEIDRLLDRLVALAWPAEGPSRPTPHRHRPPEGVDPA